MRSNECPLCGEGWPEAHEWITDEMVERVGRALCDRENAKEQVCEGRPTLLVYEEWRDEYDADARTALEAALREA